MEAPKPDGFSNVCILSGLNENNPFSVKMKLEENKIFMTLEMKDSFLQKIYEGIFSLQEIQENKYFLQFDTIEEIFEELNLKSKLNPPEIIKENDNFVIKISLFSSKFKDVEFTLKQRKKNNEDKFKELYSIIKELKNENFELRQEINSIKDENVKFKQALKILIDNHRSIKGKIIKTENEKISLDNSLILNGDEEKIKQLYEFLSPNSKVGSELKYRMSRDGVDFDTFHELYDNISPNLLLIEDEKGNIFGEYATVSWEKNDYQKIDPDSFLFSLNKNKKYYPKHKNGYHIFCYSCFGPRFSGGNISFQNYNMSLCMSTKKGEYLDESLSTNKSGYYFKVKEVEFYQIFIN